MKIKDIICAERPTLSFEIFPPKPGADFEPVKKAAEEIAKLKPDFISVTYGAGGGTSSNTIKIASYIQQLGVTALAHLTCASSTKYEVEAVLQEIKQNNIENVLALRGDIPEGSDFPQPNQYRYASELVEHIKKSSDICVGGACYPEGHTESPTRAEDIIHMKIKADMGCDFLTTQMFFDNNILYNYLYHIREAGITTPVLAGIMPVTNGKQIARICQLSGTILPQRFRAIVDKFGDKPESMKQAGIAYATDQIIDLIANGVKGIHVYSMNKSDVAAKIVENLSEIMR